MKKLQWVCALVSLCCLGSGVCAAPTELITNGGFESGDFAGWTTTDVGTFLGDLWYVDTPGTTTPSSGHATLATGGSGSFGNWYAVTDQAGPGTHSLTQSFTVASPISSAILSFDMFVNDWNGWPLLGPLDHTGGPVQFGTVDILSAGADPFDTGGGVLANYYLGVDPYPDPAPFTRYSFDITGIIGGGGTFQIRFAEADNQLWLNQGVDNVSVAVMPVPVPSAVLLGLIGVAILAHAMHRRRKKTMAAA